MDRHRVRSGGVRKRSAAACARCRQQKIKCSGTNPCFSCSKRHLVCDFDDSTHRVLVTKGYLKDLQSKAQQTAGGRIELATGPALVVADEGSEGPVAQENVSTWLGLVPANVQQQETNTSDRSSEEDRQQNSSTPTVQLMNPLAMDSGNFMSNERGRPYHLGSSSNWSFGRRVLRMCYEKLGTEPPPEGLHFEGQVYDLNWQRTESSRPSCVQSLPTADYAVYLINAVKFHCGQIFHLFDEDDFMKHFTTFHEHENGVDKVPDLWYIHYLLIVAFGKAFVVHNVTRGKPPGADLFMEAMKYLPEITLFHTDRIETIEILICAALYLQCLDFRSSAFNLIGQAVRKALELGMHTQMSSLHLTDETIQRCRQIWWTAYVLDRQMSSLMGLPMAIRDQDITAVLPVFTNASSKRLAMELNVKLSKVIADILNTVYSTQGRRSQKFLACTKQALKTIAFITGPLNEHFAIPENDSSAAISRTSAYLQLLRHQCIALTTRPLVYSFFERRLNTLSRPEREKRPTGSVRALLTTCVDSAQQMLHILSSLQKQGLLESFLPFDLESVFISMMILTMSVVIDNTLLEGHDAWARIANNILEEMISRGNLIALMRQKELQRLASFVADIPPYQSLTQLSHDISTPNPEHNPLALGDTSDLPGNMMYNQEEGLLEDSILHRTDWHQVLSAEQLLLVADTLDLDGLDWMTASLEDSSVQSQIL